MTLLYLDDRMLRHETGRHPENPRRLQAIASALRESGLLERCQRPAWPPATRDQQLAVHTAEYLQQLADCAAGGGGQIEQDTVMSADSYDVAQLASGAACDAVDRVLGGEDTRAFCAIRPPGHHALRAAAMGFCLLNHVALAAHHARKQHQLNRILIVDWDVHHGNGTQAIFWEDPHVGFFSIHRWPFYPGTGAASETGDGPGADATLNVPVEFGTSRSAYHRMFRTALQRFADHVQPELILLSAGFDAHRADPVGSLGLETEDFSELTRQVLEVADTHAKGRVVSLLEGGYHPRALGESVVAHLETLLDE